jgi:carbamoyl-phosphate synthase large subunit
MSKTILFGGSGFLGNIFLREYPDIISVGRREPGQGRDNSKHIYCTMDDLSPLDDVEFDNVIFLVGNSNHHQINSSCMMGIDYNVIPLKKILHYLKNRIANGRPINKFICFTSILLYGNKSKNKPVNEQDEIYPYQNEYIFSKFLAEQLYEFYKNEVPIINIRLCNIYGDTSLIRPDLVPTLVYDSLVKNKPTVWNKTPKRDFIFTVDAASAIMKLLETNFTGYLNLGSGKTHSVGEITDIISKLSNKQIDSLDIPVEGVMEFKTDITLLQKLTNWNPKYTLSQGLKLTYQVMKDTIKLNKK